MKKINAILILILVTTLLSGCNIKENHSFRAVLDNIQNIDPRNPGKYATSLDSVTNNDKPIKCKNGAYKWQAAVTNVYDSAEYGLFLFVNGVLTPFSTDFEEDELEMHIIVLGESDKILFSVSVKEENIVADEKIYASLVTILNPRHTLSSTDYINYLPHHALASFSFYVLEKAETSVKSAVISAADGSEKLSEKLDEEYLTEITDKSGNEKIINSLDSVNDFILTDNKEFSRTDSLYAVVKGKALKLKLGCLGKKEKFRISVFINNNIIPAFDENFYCDVETQRNRIITKDITISAQYLSLLNEFSHIYLIAVPLEPDFDEEKYDRPIKTTTKMLYISSEENIKMLKEQLSGDYDDFYAFKNDHTVNISETHPFSETQTATINISTKPTVTTERNTEDYASETTKTHVEEKTTTEKPTEIITTKPTETTENVEPATTKKHKPQEVAEKSTEHKTKESDSSSTSYKDSKVNFPVWDLWVIDKKTALIKSMTNGKLYLYNIENGKIEKSVQGGEKVQKLDNGFAVLTLYNSGYTVYDKNLNKITSGKLPYSTERDELVYAVSQDGKSIAYCINKNGKGSVYIDSVSQSSRKKVTAFSSASKVGTVTWIDDITAFKDGNILFSGSYTERIDSKGNIVGQTCYGCITTSGKITKQTSNGYNRLCSKGSNMVVADNSPLSAGNTDGTIEYWNVKSGKGIPFSFSKGNESRYAVVSEHGKYIASEEIHSDCSGITVRIYDTVSKKVVYKEKYNYSGLEAYPIDFCESDNFAVLAIDSSVHIISLK